MERKRLRYVVKGILYAILSYIVLGLCGFTTAVYVLSWRNGFEGADGPLWAIPLSATLGVANTIFFGYYLILPLTLVGAVTGYLWLDKQA